MEYNHDQPFNLLILSLTGPAAHFIVREKRPFVGYLRCGVILFTISATANSIVTPDSTGDSTYRYPNDLIFSEPITAINAVAPPGGCRVLVNCMPIMDSETANGAVSQIISGISL